MQRPQDAPAAFQLFEAPPLQRAQAVPPAQRSPEVAAFVEAMQLGEEACALLPLVRVPSAPAAVLVRPALPATEATATACCWQPQTGQDGLCVRRHQPFQKIVGHLEFYLMRGCGATYPPSERCTAELGALLRRNDDSALGPYLWMYASAFIGFRTSHLETAVALQQLGDALADADLGSLDRQLGELQGAASTTSGSDLLITSRQIRWACYLPAYQHASSAKRETQGSDAELAARMRVHCASNMKQLEPP